MGVLQVPVIMRNWQNRFLPEDQQGKDVRCMATVDSGAAELALPADMVERLKLTETGNVRVYTADAGEHLFRVFGIVDLEVQGRSCQVRRSSFLDGAEPLLGAVPLKENWHVDGFSQEKLLPIPSPRRRRAASLCRSD